MIPFFFGSRDKQLFGIYHPSKSKTAYSHGILICPPVGQEHLRTYMALRQLALALSSIGFDVLKFDYYGVGDSAGDSKQGNVDIWKEDVRHAYQELKDVTGVRSVSILGLRLGAALAALSVSAGLQVKNLLLWDPVVNGAEYIRELRELTLNLLSGKSESKGDGCEVLVGFPYSTGNLFSISEIDLLKVSPKAEMNMHLVLSEEKAQYIELCRHIESFGQPVEMKILPDIGILETSGNWHGAQSLIAQWSDQDEFDQALIAHAAITEIVAIMGKAL